MAPPTTIELDGRAFRIRFDGFGASLGFETAAGGEAWLPPWRLADHLAALDHTTRVHDGGPAVDAEAFAAEVLAGAGVTGPDVAALTPLALWWAAGGAPAPAPTAGAWIDLGGARVRLRPWTVRERLQALASCRRVADDGAVELVVVDYLEAMIVASAAEREPAQLDLGDLDSAQSAQLLIAVVAANAPDGIDDDLAGLDRDLAGRAAAATLRVCRALGWTPSQVWSAPAAEVTRIERLLELADDAPRRRVDAQVQRPTGLASHADAVVIRIDEDA